MVSKLHSQAARLPTHSFLLVTIRPPQRRPGLAHARRAQEWRNPQRPPRQLRYLDEFDPEGSGANKSRRRQVLSITRGLRSREQRAHHAPKILG